MHKKLILSVVLIIVVVISCDQNDTTHQPFDHTVLDSIGDHFIPDRRVEVFEYKIEEDTGRTIIQGSTTHPELKDSLENYISSLPDTQIQSRILLLPADTLENKWGLTNLSVANIRSRPAHSSELVTQSVLGTPVKILSRKDDWWQIQTPDAYIGWVDAAGIYPLSETELQSWKSSERVIFTEFTGRILAEPDEGAPYISDIVMGGILEASPKIKKGYREVIMPDGRRGWLDPYALEGFNERMKGYVKSSAVELELTGLEMLGVPYLWGGTSPKAMDCSGYTKMIFWMHGLILPRDASQQVNVGAKVEISDSLENLMPGDLIYFGRYAEDSSHKVTHVALHLGERQILHAAGKVKIESLRPADSLFNAYRYNTMLSARRILGVSNEYGIMPVNEHPWYY